MKGDVRESVRDRWYQCQDRQRGRERVRGNGDVGDAGWK